MGRSYVAFEGISPVDRFEVSRQGSAVWVRAPREARLALVCDGEVASEAVGLEVELRSVQDTSRCHVEAWLGDRLWIVTSRLG